MVLTPLAIDRFTCPQHASKPRLLRKDKFSPKNGRTSKSRVQETEDLKAEILKVRKQSGLVASSASDDAIRKVNRIDNKIRRLETEVRCGERAKQMIVKKDTENDMLRKINKDLRGTITNLSKQLNSVMKDGSVKMSVPASDDLIEEVLSLKEYRHNAENKIRELEFQELDNLRTIDQLNDILEGLNSSFDDVTDALVVKSKDYFILEAELDQARKSSRGRSLYY